MFFALRNVFCGVCRVNYAFCNCLHQSNVRKRVNTKCYKLRCIHNTSSNSIIISTSRDIYRNLALEDWLYKNYDFTSKNICILLMWYNHPAVVIGRHQNPWLECSMDVSKANGISIARRNSGGGTVYHDFGNLNCSFFTSRKNYNRKCNLSLICQALRSKWSLNLKLSDREDILLDAEYKISGTASKLGKNNAYHHCTVLVDVNEIMLHQVLHRELHGIESKATSSVKSSIKNLKSVTADMSVHSVMEMIKNEYQSLYGVTDNNIFTLNPTDNIFHGLHEMEQQSKSWEWLYGKTPKFLVSRSFPLCPSFSKWSHKNMPLYVEIQLLIVQGQIEKVSVSENILEENVFDSLQECVQGTIFSVSELNKGINKWLALIHNDTVLCKYIKTCFLQIIQDIYR